jgi:hypothetical protein
MFTLRSRNYHEPGPFRAAEVIPEGISLDDNVLLQTILGFIVSISSLRVISGAADLT